MFNYRETTFSFGQKPYITSNLVWPVGVKLLHGKRGRKGAIPDATAEFERATGWDWVGWATLMCHEKQTHQSKRRSLETLEDAQEYFTLLIRLEPL